MIQRFNFYDIYGYLIPGLTFMLLVWLPYGIVHPGFPDDKLSTAVVAIVVGYLIGHLIVAIAGELISGKTLRDADGKLQYPSIVVLDASNKLLYPEAKTQIAITVKGWFSDIDLHVEKDANAENPTIAGIRQGAFFRCRPIVNKSTAYAEQFQGLYSMMSGLAVTFALGIFYVGGWAVAALLEVDVAYARWGLILSLVAMVLLAISRIRQRFAKPEESQPWDAARVIAFALFLLSGGYLLAIEAHVSGNGNLGAVFCVVVALCLMASLLCFDAYRRFANEFAKAIWTYLPTKGGGS